MTERLPQAMAQLSLVLAARQYPRVRILFYSIVEHWFRLPGELIMGVSVFTSLLGICSHVRNVRNVKRYPVAPTVTGLVLQVRIQVCTTMSKHS